MEVARPAPAPKVRDTMDERAEKAERVAHMQHSTSLLSKGSATNPVRAAVSVQRGSTVAAEKSGGMPFMLQILFVMALAGAAAYGVSVFAPELMYSIL
jgi:hypothetical protein